MSVLRKMPRSWIDAYMAPSLAVNTMACPASLPAGFQLVPPSAERRMSPVLVSPHSRSAVSQAEPQRGGHGTAAAEE